MSSSLHFLLEEGLNLRDVMTTGAVLEINQDVDDDDLESNDCDPIDPIDGKPVANFSLLAKTMTNVDENGWVKKKILHSGGGLPINEDCTVSVSYSGYFESHLKPFDAVSIKRPLVADLNDTGLLPGLQTAVKSMLVGEISMFLFSYKVMYGEMGAPPRILPKADCVFYVKLVKSILTPKENKIDLAAPNMFQRVSDEAKMLYVSGLTLFKLNNPRAAIQSFKKAVHMLNKCRLADQKEQDLQEKTLQKIYINLAICYNTTRQPLMTCIVCKELNRLDSLWNNGKVLFQNAKALRMIGEYDKAKKKLLRAIKLVGENDTMRAEYKLLENTRQAQRNSQNVTEPTNNLGAVTLISEEFKTEVDTFIRAFKSNNENDDLFVPTNMSTDEMDYFREACYKENLFLNKIKNDVLENTVNDSKGDDKTSGSHTLQ